MRLIGRLRSSFGSRLDNIVQRALKSTLPNILPPLVARLLLHVHGIVGKFYPLSRSEGGYVIPKIRQPGGGALPLPPTALREWYGRREDGTFDDELFLSEGQEHVCSMRDILVEHGFVFAPGQRALDFGCSAGRMLRWFEDEAAESEYWGVDMSAENIVWAQQNLTPPFHFAVTSDAPHLPFPDAYFDLIYAGSVFTHIAELADAWLLELRRLLKNQGRLYITVVDGKALDIMRRDKPGAWLRGVVEDFDRRTGVLSSDYALFAVRSSPKTTVIVHDGDYLVEKLSRWFTVQAVKAGAYGYQTGILLERPAN